jgi:hypothetical protein
MSLGFAERLEDLLVPGHQPQWYRFRSPIWTTQIFPYIAAACVLELIST